jgi:hypothetical protein
MGQRRLLHRDLVRKRHARWVIVKETERYDVPLMVSRGFSSDTYLQSAAEAIKAESKPTFIYQFGDHDPSGIWIAKQIERGLRHHAPDSEIYFERVARSRSVHASRRPCLAPVGGGEAGRFRPAPR